MKVSLHFYFWLTAVAATLCAWVVYAQDFGSPAIGLFTLMLTFGVTLWGFLAAGSWSGVQK